MAITIDWQNKEIHVPKNDLTLVQSSPEIRQLDINEFRLELRDIEDGEGIPYLHTHNHNTALTLGGVTFARVVEITNGYTVTFEDGQYAVNLVNGNSNIGDVTNVNQVSVRSANSAGLVQAGSGLSAEQATALIAIYDKVYADEIIPGTANGTATWKRKGTSEVISTKTITRDGVGNITTTEVAP